MSVFEKWYTDSGDNVRIVREELNGERFPDKIPSEKDRKKKVSQESFAEILDCSVDSIRSIEQGRRPLSKKMAEKISKIAEYPAPVEWLMGKAERDIEESRARVKEQNIRLAQRAYYLSQMDYKKMFDGLCLLAESNDYIITPPTSDNIDSSIIEYSIKHGDTTITISKEEMFIFKNHIADIVENQLDFLFKLKGGAQNG